VNGVAVKGISIYGIRVIGLSCWEYRNKYGRNIIVVNRAMAQPRGGSKVQN
jgi:hypothetical protein